MRVLIDMNLPPRVKEALVAAGHEAFHWSEIGAPNASDETLMRWAAEHQCVVITHDLDFSAILASTGELGPSVLQVRVRSACMENVVPWILRGLQCHQAALEQGAIVTIVPRDGKTARVRLLPLMSSSC